MYYKYYTPTEFWLYCKTYYFLYHKHNWKQLYEWCNANL